MTNLMPSLKLAGAATVTDPVSVELRAAIVPWIMVVTSNSLDTQAEFWLRQRATN